MPEKLMKTVFDWEYFNLYLSGSIDFDRTGGKSWRDDWTKRLIEIGFKPNQIFNPCKKPLAGAQFNLDDEAAIMKKHRERREWSKLTDVMSQIVHIDLRLLDLSSLILVNMPQYHLDEKVLDRFGDILDNLRKETDSVYVNMLGEMYFNLLSEYTITHIPTYGTIHEMVIAHQQHKPIYMVWEGGKNYCSAWLMWLVGANNVFATFEELLTRLKNISAGKTAFNAKDWLLFDFQNGQKGE